MTIYSLDILLSQFYSSVGKESTGKKKKSKRIHWQCRRPHFYSCVEKILWRWGRLLTPVFLDFPGGSAGKESVCNTGDLALIPGMERTPGEGKVYPLQCSGLENSMGCIVHESQRIRHDCVTFTYICNFIYIFSLCILKTKP